jgi:hypothetical protein
METPFVDDYATQLARQNTGFNCRHCQSPSGHFKRCPLLNREVAEARSATLSQADVVRLHSLGVIWEAN